MHLLSDPVFWYGALAVLLVYLLVGTAIGIFVVVTHLARFFAAGFHFGRAARHVLMCSLLWPGIFLEF